MSYNVYPNNSAFWSESTKTLIDAQKIAKRMVNTSDSIKTAVIYMFDDEEKHYVETVKVYRHRT